MKGLRRPALAGAIVIRWKNPEHSLFRIDPTRIRAGQPRNGSGVLGRIQISHALGHGGCIPYGSPIQGILCKQTQGTVVLVRERIGKADIARLFFRRRADGRCGQHRIVHHHGNGFISGSGVIVVRCDAKLYRSVKGDAQIVAADPCQR